MPASSAAMDNCERKPRSPGCASTPARWASTRRAACTAKRSLTGLAWRFHTDSRACARVSSAVSRVTAGGQLSVSAGSTKARSANPQDSSRLRLHAGSTSVSQTVAQRVTSLPVPAVVGTSHKGSVCMAGQGAVPRSAAAMASKSPSAGRHRSNLARSIVLPPPSASSTAPCEAAMRAHTRPENRRASAMLESPSGTVTQSSSCSPSAACQRACRPRAFAASKASTTAGRSPSAAGSPSLHPAPKCTSTGMRHAKGGASIR